ncbi:PfkB family carbohydrate kinase [Conexibacter arvalis]|uniref:Ribokinase n=1 Tax=Conexibacter arvalis TaxID=912552 RepID=A0A840IFU9_9ACTN|nr:ribokinase [Conexibacter arvalis]
MSEGGREGAPGTRSAGAAAARERGRFAVVGHVEWLDLAVVDHLPRAGEIVTATDHLEAAAGGGAVAAVQLRRLAGHADFYSVVGDDALGARAAAELRGALGVALHAVPRPGRGQRRAFTHVDASAERTITVLGERLVPRGEEPLPWEELAAADAVYWTGGDAAAAAAARRARVLVATGRAPKGLIAAGVRPDVVVASASDRKELAGAEALPERPRWLVLTDGARGGRWEGADGSVGRWEPATPPGPLVDAYGCGDSFAAGLTYGLGAGLPLPDALALAARCGAWCATGRGPYGRQLTGAEL